jgi:hypothetical protein
MLDGPGRLDLACRAFLVNLDWIRRLLPAGVAVLVVDRCVVLIEHLVGYLFKLFLYVFVFLRMLE